MSKKCVVLAALLGLLISGCRSYITVTSDPSGAMIVQNGMRTGDATPAKLKPFTGTLTVELESYETPPPRSVVSHVSAGRIVVTVLVWWLAAILWGFQFKVPEQEFYHFTLKPI